LSLVRASVLVTHHLEEIPETTTHALLLLAQGRVVAAGAIEDTPTSENVTEAFDYPSRLSVTAAGGVPAKPAYSRAAYGDPFHHLRRVVCSGRAAVLVDPNDCRAADVAARVAGMERAPEETMKSFEDLYSELKPKSPQATPDLALWWR